MDKGLGPRPKLGLSIVWGLLGFEARWGRECGPGDDDSLDSVMRWSQGQVNMIVIKCERNECHMWEEESSGDVGY